MSYSVQKTRLCFYLLRHLFEHILDSEAEFVKDFVLGHSDKDALTMALFDQANEIGLDMLAGGLSGGVMGCRLKMKNRPEEKQDS